MAAFDRVVSGSTDLGVSVAYNFGGSYPFERKRSSHPLFKSLSPSM